VELPPAQVVARVDPTQRAESPVKRAAKRAERAARAVRRAEAPESAVQAQAALAELAKADLLEVGQQE
jgi:hypothetical protein